MKLSSDTPVSPTEKLVKQKFALLAKVGVQKRKALGFQEEAEFYFTTVIEALAVLEDALTVLGVLGEAAPTLVPTVNKLESRQRQLIRYILSYWPKDSESQGRLLTLLDSAGVENHLGTTPEGFVSLSSDRILKSLGQILEASPAE